MLRKYFLAPAILSLACLLLVTDLAQAQRRGGYGGGRGGGWGGGRGGAGIYVGPTYPYRNYNNYGYYNNYGSSRYGWYPRDNWYSYPQTSWYTYPQTSYYYAPTTEYVAPQDQTANIRVIVPDPAARVWFDGALTRQTGTDRLFTTPALFNSGTYTIRAAWMSGSTEVMRERSVTVSPGQALIIDFTRQ